MRYLKNKIALAEAMRVQNQASITIQLRKYHAKPLQSPQARSETQKRRRVPGVHFTPEASRAIKNIPKNYGKAICNFATSSLAVPYLSVPLENEGVLLEDFVSYVLQIKGKIHGLHHFRSVLLDNQRDSVNVIKYKRLFRIISEVFIKYFSVNWIFNSKIFHKEAHLKFRFKMLRRIQSPELFTYISIPCKNVKAKENGLN